MPTHIVDGRFRRFILDYEEDEVWTKLDVIVLNRDEDPEPWIEIYQVVEGDTHEITKIPVVTAPAIDVVEFFDKIMDFIKNYGGDSNEGGNTV